MDKVRVSRESLLSSLRENRDKHEAEFKEANAVWKDTVLASVNELAFQLEQDNWDEVNLNPVAGLPRPSHHLKDYDLAIRMLEMSVDENVTIEQYDFNRYVMDEWEWRAGFDATTSNYLGAKVR